jgi:ABC-type glucose/galactose transport system permease subunit
MRTFDALRACLWPIAIGTVIGAMLGALIGAGFYFLGGEPAAARGTSPMAFALVIGLFAVAGAFYGYSAHSESSDPAKLP